MAQKIVSQLDQAGYFVAPVVADESPLEPGVFLIPGGAVDKAPPASMEPGKRYRPWGAGWRGEAVPVEPEPAAVERSAADLERESIVARLAEIDQESIRPAREVAAALARGEQAPAFPVGKLEALEAEAAAHRARLAALA